MQDNRTTKRPNRHKRRELRQRAKAAARQRKRDLAAKRRALG